VQAGTFYQRSLEIKEKILGSNSIDLTANLDSFADLYDRQHKPDDAEALYKRVIKIKEDALGPNHQDVSLALKKLASHYSEQGKYTEANQLSQRAEAMDRERMKDLLNKNPQLSNHLRGTWAELLEDAANQFQKDGHMTAAEAEKLRAQAKSLKAQPQ
jgi:truncated hemoglobin YjbI